VRNPAKYSQNSLALLVDGKKRKAQLEDGYQEAGYRTGWQVLCNSASGFVAAFLWNAAFVPTSIHARVADIVGVDVSATVLQLQMGIVYDGSEKGWCPLSRTVASGWSRTLVLCVLGYASQLEMIPVERLTYPKALFLLSWRYAGIRTGDSNKLTAEAYHNTETRTPRDERCDIR